MAKQTEVARKAADAALLTAQVAINAERPFVMVEASGNADSVTFTAWNRGRSPAKVVYMDPILRTAVVPLRDKLPDAPDYGLAYERAIAGAELVNAEWVAPGASIYAGGFGARGTYSALPEMLKELKSGSSLLYLYGSIRYKGIAGDQIYESRFCYRLGGGRWVMLGPTGYNDYR